MPSRVVPVQAPVGGWNTRDAIDDMAPEDALILDNWVPDFGSVAVRKGFERFCSVLPGPVETLFEFNAGADRNLIAVSSSRFYEVEFGTATNFTNTATISNSRWEHAQFDDASGGARVGLVNGTDAPLVITSGPTLSAMTISGSGLTPANLDGIHIHNSRSYFWDTATQDFWYSATNALGGALTKFPLGRVSGTGGNLVAMASWSTDTGAGLDDYAVFFLSSGDVLMYSGSDPGDANDWALAARYRIGAPVNKRAIIPVDGDLILVTRDGYVSLSKALFGRKTPAISDKINSAVIEQIDTFSDSFGWQAIHYPAGNKLIFNVPQHNSFVQHVLNTRTAAWCRYTGIPARCWALFNDALYLGGDGIVYVAETGGADDAAAIEPDAMCAWNYLGARGRQKHVPAIQVVLSTNGSALDYGLTVTADFAPTTPPVVAYESSEPLAPLWDVAAWDVAYWQHGDTVFRDWRGANALGLAVAVRLKVTPAATQTVKWHSTNYLVKPGGSM